MDITVFMYSQDTRLHFLIIVWWWLLAQCSSSVVSDGENLKHKKVINNDSIHTDDWHGIWARKDKKWWILPGNEILHILMDPLFVRVSTMAAT